MKRRTQRRILRAFAVCVFLCASSGVQAQNYARYCARDTDQLANDLTNAITSQDENYIATLYYWAGFSAQNGYRKMDDFIRMTQRNLIAVTPLGGGMALLRERRRPTVRLLSAGLGSLSQPQEVPPIESTPEIGPFRDEEDERGLGTLPPLPSAADLPPEGIPGASQTIDPLLDSEAALAQSQRRAEEFDRQLRAELEVLEENPEFQSAIGTFGFAGPPATAIRVEQEEGRIRRKKVLTVFGIVKYEDCYWLTGG